MSVNLSKGQKVELTKGNSGLKRIIVGLGWQEVKKKGFLGLGKSTDVDCDASAILISEGEKLNSKDDVIYYANLRHKSGCVTHMGDNLTGGTGIQDDEQIIVDLADIPAKYSKIIFVVNIYGAVQKNQHFGMIKNAFIRICDASNNQEICKYNLSENYDHMTAMIFGEVFRSEGEWKFNAVGQATNDPDLAHITKRYQ